MRSSKISAFPRALVSPVLLVLLAESPGHGYELVERLKAFGFGGARTGSCYRELRRLENQDLVTSFWEQPAGALPAGSTS